jgi:hypothetical protein
VPAPTRPFNPVCASASDAQTLIRFAPRTIKTIAAVLP